MSRKNSRFEELKHEYFQSQPYKCQLELWTRITEWANNSTEQWLRSSKLNRSELERAFYLQYFELTEEYHALRFGNIYKKND